MHFALDHVVWFLDGTILNPALAWVAPVALQYLTSEKITVSHTPNGLILYAITAFPRAQQLALGLFAVAAWTRISRLLERRALNNGRPALKFQPTEETVVVTGGAGGIGGEAVKKFAAKGAKVAVLDVLELTYPKPAGVRFYKVDLTDYDALQRVATTIREEMGEPTTVLANAGIVRGKTVLDATVRDIELTYKVNNFALLWCAKVFLPAMIKKDSGHFLITASSTAYVTAVGAVDYSSSKAAALAIYEGLQTELKHVYQAPSVRLSVVCPSTSRTKMFESIKTSSNFMVPELTPAEVAENMYNIVASGYSQQLITPAFANIFPLVRFLPAYIRVGFQDGGAGAMAGLNPHDPLASKK